MELDSRLQNQANAVANMMGTRYDRHKRGFLPKPIIAGPLGLNIPLSMRFSHGVTDKSFGTQIDCYKVAGDLYASFVYEADGDRSTVLLLDKKKHAATSKQNMVSYAQSRKGDSLAEYVRHFRHAIIGAWSRAGASDKPWKKMSLGD